jgi:hypothetical protein
MFASKKKKKKKKNCRSRGRAQLDGLWDLHHEPAVLIRRNFILQRSFLYNLQQLLWIFADLDFDRFNDKLLTEILHRKRTTTTRKQLTFFDCSNLEFEELRKQFH